MRSKAYNLNLSHGGLRTENNKTVIVNLISHNSMVRDRGKRLWERVGDPDAAKPLSVCSEESAPAVKQVTLHSVGRSISQLTIILSFDSIDPKVKESLSHRCHLSNSNCYRTLHIRDIPTTWKLICRRPWCPFVNVMVDSYTPNVLQTHSF